jgi:hypothetical protein
MTTGYALYFESEDVAKLVKGKLEDGMLDIGDKMFDVNSFKPRMLRKGFGFYPLYLIRWDCVNPENEFNPKFEPDNKLSPEILKKTMSLKVLGNMLKVKREVNKILWLIIGLAFGAFLAYALFAVMK